jgi:tetratricopeptide (TPR) repeat protein
VFLELGDQTRGFADLDRAVEHGPQSGAVHFARGMERRNAGDLAGSLPDYEQAHELDPTNNDVLAELALVCFELGDATRTAALATQGLERDSSSVVLRRMRAFARCKLGDAEGARLDADFVVRAEPGAADAWGFRALILEPFDLDASLESARRAASLGADQPQAHLILADLLVARGDLAGAKPELERAFAINPNNPEAHASRVKFALRRGDLAAALADTDRVIELSPHRGYGHALRAEVLRRQGELDRALAEIELANGDYGTLVAVGVRGLIRSAKGDKAGARADLAAYLKRARPFDDFMPEVKAELQKLSR